MRQAASPQLPDTDEKAPQATSHHGDRQPWELYTLVGALIAECAVVLLGNPPYVSAWLLAILALSIGQALLLPSNAAWLGGLVGLVAWVLFRQVTGIWATGIVAQGMAELAVLGLAVGLTVRYSQVWRHQQQELQELRELRRLLVAGEIGTGLLPREVAELRLREELDRAQLFRRPLGLLLIELEPLREGAAVAIDPRDAYQAVARQIIGASLVHDLPFRISSSRIGVILLERDWNRLYEDGERIVSAAQSASIPDSAGRTHAVSLYAKLNFGLGTYQGEQGSVDLMRAASDSLHISRDLAELGAARLSTYAMPATAIELSGPAVSNEEE